MARRLASSTRWLLGAGALIVLVAVLGLVVGDARGGADQFPEGSPEAVVRDFITAVRDRDTAGMREVLAPGLRGACDERDMRRLGRDDGDTEARVTLADTEVLNGTAEVEVRRSDHTGEPPFGDAGYTRSEVFELTRHQGDWLIRRVPWSYHACPGWSR